MAKQSVWARLQARDGKTPRPRSAKRRRKTLDERVRAYGSANPERDPGEAIDNAIASLERGELDSTDW